MENRNRFFDDVAKVAGSAAGTLSGLKNEIESRSRQKLDDIVARFDLVTRDEFDAVAAVAVKAREEQEALTTRLASLEAEVARLKGERPA